ncbi:MAG TPA: family 31 carbohydrate-binding protein [Povalibacter sp.]|uniref:family 31 carbohydrate-binding protein n=1 Tax=Povalibacter sp. TaxID=1962978 RepID=UPI002C6679B1|nr:family 31 carbohydrate-binding protein [Povalibacter sp.]HMN47222.1 family 31 carbohydrate-binding protein [Povalibacter sp.]
MKLVDHLCGAGASLRCGFILKAVCALFLFAPAAAMAAQGIEKNGSTATLWFDDGGWTGSWNYLCLGESCIAGSKVGTRWQRTITEQSITVGNTYQIQIKIQNNGTGQYISPMYSVTATAAGGGGGGGAPAVPTGLTVGSATSSSLTVSWTASGGATRYDVYRGGSLVASPSGTSLVNTSLAASTTYSYTVRACNAANECSAQSSPVSGTTSASTPPGGGGGAGQFGIDGAGKLYHVDEGWTASFNYLCLNGACSPGTRSNGRFERSVTVTAGASYSIEFKVQDNTVGQCLTGAQPITYVAGGASIASSCASPDVTAPSVPTGLQATAQNGHAVQLTWTASTDDKGVAKYDVYRNGGATAVGSPTTNSFVNTGLNEQTAYTYRVRACDAAGNCSAQSAPVSVTTPVFVPDVTAPSVPAGLQTTAVNPTSVALAWTASTDLGGVVAKYDVYRNGTLAASPTGTTATIAGLSSGVTYAFRVRACDDSSNCSAQSAVLNVTTPVVPINVDTTSNSYSDHNVGPPPRANPPAALPTPINGVAPTSHGFAFDINGSTLTWRWGPQNVTGVAGSVRTPGDSGLEMHCSMNGNATFQKASVVNGTATIPCTGTYTYFFRYQHPNPLNNTLSSRWIYTALFTTAGARVNPAAYTPFVDGSANWMRPRHPISHDGITAAVIDNQSNAIRIRDLDRYTLWVNDSPGNVQLNYAISGSVLRVESLRNDAGAVNGQNFFAVEQNPGFGGIYSYGQVIQFEITAIAGRESAQTYNDFMYYTVGYGWGSYGDPRLKSAGKAGTTMWVSDTGAYSALEHNAVFTQPMVTVHTEDLIDDFLVGHHIFHGIDPNKRGSSLFDDPDVRIGDRSCGSCHFRDGRGSEVIQTAKGPRLPPPVYGVKLLDVMVGRQAGFTWDGSATTLRQQVENALVDDHHVQVSAVPVRAVDLMTSYIELLTVPNRDPGAYDQPGVAQGDVLFGQVGCASCHTPVQYTSSSAPTHLRNLEIRPYTDMKTWNVNGGSFRTAPLWGLGHNIALLQRNGRALRFMHDGSATSVDAAVQKHDGAAATSRAQYNALSATDRANIVKFVESL